jgi:hypothetical protein
MVKTKEEIREYKRQYYIKNREEILRQQKEYSKNNKEACLSRQKEYYENNKEVILSQRKEWRETHREERNMYQKEYRKTPIGIKNRKISHWRIRGLISDNYDEIYEKYINTTHCENCNIELTTGRFTTSTTRVMDHNHSTGEFRNILCHSCNIKRG